MEFRSPNAAAEKCSYARTYLTENLDDPEAGKAVFEELREELGNVIENFPSWHPILTAPPQPYGRSATSISSLDVYRGRDHTVEFVRGFVTCPYSEEAADNLVEAVNKLLGLHARRLDQPLYADNAYPVVVSAIEVELEADGTIRSRDALAWFVQEQANSAPRAEVAETWWTMRSYILGRPHGSRSSLCVNQYTGSHMRKILEAMNDSGMFGPIKEWSLDMLSGKKRETIASTLIRAALKESKKLGLEDEEEFSFELRGETCRATVRDTWSDGTEYSVRVWIGQDNVDDLSVSGLFNTKDDRVSASDPNGKLALAKKFL
ncbi:hypothetical protein [Leisingera sp. McT4-56]|uniref:hypothetical protein n=1 Tax=Leisingera sp. McT4-56 TaxID=2881255 RepID=UPI001CF85DCB|nr:hypothetical protein [Leisingera sp. McT4-56]MCB4456875.1 hypothetical protein [Leisingera sp. McT4-56]